MKLKFLFLATFLFSLTTYGQTTRIDWSLPLASGSADRGHAIEIDASGNTYVTGYFQGTVNFNPNGTANLTSTGGFDIFIAKYDSDGNYLWAHKLGGASADEAFDIALDGSNNVYVTGYFQGAAVDFDPGGSSFLISSNGAKDAFLLKLDTDGNFVWAFNIGSSTDDQGNAISIDGSNNVYLVGKFTGSTVDFDPSGASATHTSAGLTDIFIAKYNSSKVYQWSKGTGSTQDDSAESITLDNSSNIYVTGSFIGFVDFNPGSTAQNLASGSAGGSAFIAKYTSAGVYSAKMQIGGVDFAELSGGSAIITDGTTNLYLAGAFLNAVNPVDFGGGNTLQSTSSDVDMFVAKYTLSTLSYVDAFRVGGTSGQNIAIGIDLDASNNVYITGNFSGTSIDFNPDGGTSNTLSSVGKQDMFIAKYSSSLVYQEAFSAGGAEDDLGYEIKVDGSGNMHSIGFYSATGIDFDPSTTNVSTLAYGGVNDAFVIKYHATEQAVPLPVELTYFDGVFKNDVNVLSWQTATETNNSHFDIEWSANGIDFEKVGEIKGFGNSLEALNYQFLHKEFTSELNYYRLKQVDFDSQYEYSSIIIIKNSIAEQTFANIFPNPTNGNLSLDTDYEGIVEIIDGTGRLVRTFSATNTNQFSISDLPNGVYFIKLNHLIKRIVKQ
jgi:hypothetical protein